MDHSRERIASDNGDERVSIRCSQLLGEEKSMIKLVVPKGLSEQQEAEWWDAHQEALESNFLEAMENGTIKSGNAERLLREARESEKVSLARADIERAKKLSKKRKVDYETFIRNLFHQAIEREEQSVKRHKKTA
jgi:predicted DNA binding CopG/RHH family protein